MSCRPARRPRRRWQPIAYPSRATSAETFADISSNNFSFDAPAYASAGHLLIAIKATEGGGYINPSWSRWTQEAHAARLSVMHYHFCDLANPTSEAEHFWLTVRPHFNKKVDRLAIDLEVGNQSAWPAYLRRFDQELYRLSGVEAIGYTMASALTPTLTLRSGKWWVASWGTKQPGGAFRRVPNGTLWAWQYANGVVDPSGGPRSAAGIGDCDMSVLAPPIVTLTRRTLGR